VEALMLKSRIPEIAAELQFLIEGGLAAGAEVVAEAAKQRVPVETGELRDAIHVDKEPEGVYVIAGDSRTFYAHFVEHGTTRTAPRPFLVPALEASRGEIEKIASAGLRKAVEGLSVKF
jgi:HK97 gp10 family phage protein